MYKITLIILSFYCFVTYSQEKAPKISEDTTKNWKLTSLFGANGTQSSFVNWNAGGRNNISILGYFSGSSNYEKRKFKWVNDLDVSLGGLQYIGKENGNEGLQKTDDKIELSTTIGQKLNKNEALYVSLLVGFKTQILDGFAYPNDSVRISTWLAPGYLNCALGVDYVPNDNFTLFVSPFGSKFTIVNDTVLANAGAFGVQAATYDGNGALVTAGRKLRSEFGTYMKMSFNRELMKNIEMKSTVELFSNYLDQPQNIDVNADILFTFKVNNWFSASLNWTAIYDDDIQIQLSNGKVGPRFQFKSVLGLGISYTLRNYTETK